jgi:colanic acid/amylovoran biosynthesis glycosyltransferase
MKVIHYCGTFSKLSETFIYDVIVALEQAGIKGRVIANKIIKQDERPFSGAILLKNSRLHLITKLIKKALSKMKLCSFDPVDELVSSRRSALARLLADEKPDIIHAHFGSQGVVVLPVALTLGIPLIVSFHGYDAFRLPNEPGWVDKYQQLFEGAKIITVVSEMMFNHLIGLGCPAAKLKLIHVGKKLSDYPFSARKSKPVRNFVSVGRLQEKKGFKDCINAFQLLYSRYPDLTLKIIGTGIQEDILKMQIKEDQQHITFLGAMSHQDTKKCIAEADAFILCSKTGLNGDKEGIPVVLMEAQALGIPCVATRHSGIPEVIPAENQWLLAKEGNAADIAAKIEDLINAPAERLESIRLTGRKEIESDFNLDIQVAKLKDIYRSISHE